MGGRRRKWGTRSKHEKLGGGQEEGQRRKRGRRKDRGRGAGGGTEEEEGQRRRRVYFGELSDSCVKVSEWLSL